MSEILPEIPPFTTDSLPTPYVFVAVVNGVAATTFKVHDRAASVLGSNPIFVQIAENTVIPVGSIWDGQNFIVNTES
jgi:hypothetical protein